MIYRTFRNLFWGIGLLAALSASAQEQEFDSELQLSNDEVIYWYRICSAVPGMDDYAMTDYNGMTLLTQFFDTVFLMPTETDNHHSQWKLTAGKDGKVVLTNRATGHQIDSKSSAAKDANHNFTLINISGTPGFSVTSLGDDAFKLESVEDDGVNRCLAMAEKDGEALAYPETGESTSAIGWKFFPVEIDTEIGSAKAGRSVINVKGKRISVSGCPEWQLFNAAGEEMPRTVALPTGVYMVKMPQKTVKILIP
jgi:hypothetical protein